MDRGAKTAPPRARPEPGVGAPALVMEIRRSYLPVNDRGNIEGSERIQTYVKGELDAPTSTSRSSLTLRPLERPFSDPVRRPTWNVG